MTILTGSGATGLAAIRSGRGFVGIELDPTYSGIAKERIWGVSMACLIKLHVQMKKSGGRFD